MGFSVHHPILRVQQLRSGIQTALVVSAMLFILGACASTPKAPAQDVITVTGDITVRGNVPFTEVVLISDDNNWYLLELTNEQRDELMTPARATVTGPISLGEWNGRPFTRLRVDELIPVRQ